MFRRVPFPPIDDGKILDLLRKYIASSASPICVCDQCGAIAHNLVDLMKSHAYDCPDRGIEYGS